VLEVPPRVTVVVSTWAAPATAAIAIMARRAPAATRAARRPLREGAVKARSEILGIDTAPLWKRLLSREL
jgi:hypothetical protein